MTLRITPGSGTHMGETRAELTVTNLFRKTSVHIRALVDTGADYLIVTEEVAKALGFDPEEFTLRRVTLADGRSVRVPMIGPIQIDFEDRNCKTEAFVLGEQCLLGFIPLECMDLVVDPRQQRLVGRHPGGPVFRA